MKNTEQVPKPINLIKPKFLTLIDTGKLCPMMYRTKQLISPGCIFKFEYEDCQHGALVWVFTINQN